MASLRKKPKTPYWIACYTTHDGRRAQRSTRQTDRKIAQKIADSFEKAEKLAATKRLGTVQAQKVLSEIHEAVNGEPLTWATTRDFLGRWLESRRVDTAPSTFVAYEQVVREFLESMGARADLDITQATKTDVANYRNAVLERTSVSTANKCLKYLRIPFKVAVNDGVLLVNPAGQLNTLKQPVGAKKNRRPFTNDELRSVFAHASPEWKGVISFGLYSGQRLGDITHWKWSNIDIENKVFTFISAKTGRPMRLPLVDQLTDYLSEVDAGDDPNAYIFPTLGKIKTSSTLSQQFHDILASAGLVPARSKKKVSKGKGRNTSRTVSPLSFHSLRHMTTSLLKKAGVPEAVVRDIIGHESEVVSRHYTHIDDESKRKAIEGLPNIFTEATSMDGRKKTGG